MYKIIYYESKTKYNTNKQTKKHDHVTYIYIYIYITLFAQSTRFFIGKT